MPTLADFDEKYRVDPETGCWVWMAARANGYGRGTNGHPPMPHLSESASQAEAGL